MITTAAMQNWKPASDRRNQIFSLIPFNLPFNESTDFNEESTNAGYKPANRPTSNINPAGIKIKYKGKVDNAGIDLPIISPNTDCTRGYSTSASVVATRTNSTDSVRNCRTSWRLRPPSTFLT